MVCGVSVAVDVSVREGELIDGWVDGWMYRVMSLYRWMEYLEV